MIGLLHELRLMTRTFHMLLVMGALVLAGGVGFFLLAKPGSGREKTPPSAPSLIEDGFYMGGLVSRPPPGTNAVLNLCEKKDPYQCKNHTWAAIEDGPPAPDLGWLRKRVAFIDARRKVGDTVYVHCAAGRSRSGMVVVAYEMYKHNWTREEALTFVRSKRPVTRLNPAFWDRLREWQYELREERRTKKR